MIHTKKITGHISGPGRTNVLIKKPNASVCAHYVCIDNYVWTKRPLT